MITKRTVRRKKQEQEQSFFMKPIQNIVQGIFKRSKTMVKLGHCYRKFDDLYSLLYKESLLIQAYGNIKGNKGSLTPGTNAETVDSMSMRKIQRLALKLKQGKFKFKLIRRKWIPKIKRYKPGEVHKSRPLGIPNFEDRLIQEAIRIILEAIYEPVFEEQDSNYGFRPNKGTHHNISKLKRLGTGCNIAIEGDIEGAYDNVDHQIMIRILRKRIQDVRFLKFLKQGFRAGILNVGVREDSLLGVPQGGLASPILFNIYMNEFDEYVNTEINEYINEYNLQNNRQKKPKNKIYDALEQRVIRARNKYNNIKLGRKWVELDQLERKQALEVRNRLKVLTKERSKVPSLNIENRQIRLVYTRYADDWIVLINSKKPFAMELKQKIEKWLLENLKLKLSPTKTLVTNIKSGAAKFLGFSIRTYTKRRLSSSSYGELTKRAGWDIIIDIDEQRLLDRLYLKGFSNKNDKPIAKKPWSVLTEEQIVTKYNDIIRGIGNYYFPVLDRRSKLQRIIYILYFSALGTLAKKLSTKITKLREKFGNPIIIKYTQIIKTKKKRTELQEKTVSKELKLLNYMDLQFKIGYKKYNWKNTKNIDIPESDIFKPMRTINWRSRRNLTNFCLICGTYENVEMHHISAIRKGKVIGFAQVMKQLNRKAIPLCRQHHKEVHMSKYDDIKLTDLIDVESILL